MSEKSPVLEASERRLRFGGLESPYCDYERSRVVVLPVPLEQTTSYGKGTGRGPLAILAASEQVELYDEELGSEPFRMGIATLPPLLTEGVDHSSCLVALQVAVEEQLRSGRFVLSLGGEHSLTQAPVQAAQSVFGDLGIVQFDAHADLREDYEGTRLSHASVMRRILEQGVPSLAIGIRALSSEEAELIDRRNLAVVWGHELAQLTAARFSELLARLPDRIYLTFDVDFLDPALLPATGTPEPGGGTWYPTLRLLRTLFQDKDVVAMDLVELAPDPRLHASDFTVARLAYKCLAYLQEATVGPRSSRPTPHRR